MPERVPRTPRWPEGARFPSSTSTKSGPYRGPPDDMFLTIVTQPPPDPPTTIPPGSDSPSIREGTQHITLVWEGMVPWFHLAEIDPPLGPYDDIFLTLLTQPPLTLRP